MAPFFFTGAAGRIGTTGGGSSEHGAAVRQTRVARPKGEGRNGPNPSHPSPPNAKGAAKRAALCRSRDGRNSRRGHRCFCCQLTRDQSAPSIVAYIALAGRLGSIPPITTSNAKRGHRLRDVPFSHFWYVQLPITRSTHTVNLALAGCRTPADYGHSVREFTP